MTTTHNPVPARPDSGIHRILVAMDLTAYSDRAFDRAVMLARENRATLRFLHVVDPNLLPERYVDRDIREARARLELEVKDADLETHLDVSVNVVTGDAGKAIVDEAKAIQADLIVTGLSQDASLAGMFRGTTVDKIVRQARCPVLIVKTRARRPYANIAAAIDLEEPSRQALDVALRIVPNGRFTILHVDEAARPDMPSGAPNPASIERRHRLEDMVAARCAAVGRVGPGSEAGPQLIIEGGRALTVLQEQVARLSPDLVVLGTHGRSGVANLVLGSVAATMLEVLPRDVLVARG